jgi:hypothetical protein
MIRIPNNDAYYFKFVARENNCPLVLPEDSQFATMGRGSFDRLRRPTLHTIADILELQLAHWEKANSILLRKKLNEKTETLRGNLAHDPMIGEMIQSLPLKQTVLRARLRNEILPRRLMM